MKKFVIIPLLLVATTSFAQVLIRVSFDEMGSNWNAIDKSFLEWEVWVDPMAGTKGWTTDFRERVTEEDIVKSIEAHRHLTDKYSGEFMLELPVEAHGIYHIGARNKFTGELLGHTACSVDYLTSTYGGGLGWPNPFNDDPVIGLEIDGEDTIFCCANIGCRTPYLGWED